LPPAVQIGGVKRRMRLCLAGSWGAIHGAPSAVPITTSRMSVPTIAAGLRASLRQPREPVAAGATSPA
jgi:hypothetical protein